MTSFIKSAVTFLIWIFISNIYQLNVVADQQSSNAMTDNVQRTMQDVSPLEQMSRYLKSKKSWQNLQGSWGKRNIGYPLEEYSDDALSNRYADDDLFNGDFQDVDTAGYADDGDVERQEYYPDKRAWKSMHGGWGKRIGTWGKREPGWNNLKGLWGKRSTNWNKLSSAWGKRSV
ncbi:allatostatins MIP [Bradysia coprophila]|uniref:allatostatins MIP n=1 Tax=Bradysia coprophila TaxID=38358 RepID=UPI00187DA0A4|nr:allatostatins MIP [Bradysia coprophila]XP_037045631.1 allatostatins MIP [Bradysia coprophila]XP_037045632.1 allatostatins MIP [Bradysia coprophila]